MPDLAVRLARSPVSLTLLAVWAERRCAIAQDFIMTSLLQEPRQTPMAAPSRVDSDTSLVKRPTLLFRVLNAIPTVLTLGLLGGVAAFGHHYGWKMPKAAELGIVNAAKAKQAAEWCSEHGVPEAICVECNKDLMPFCKKPRWCKEHGVSECPTHHPELAQVKGTAKLPQYDTVAALALMDRVENNSRCKKFTRRIQYESLAAFEKMGIDVDVASERAMEESLRINGELGYDQAQIAHLSTRSSGSVWKVFKRVGEQVKVGDVLALVDAAEVGKAKTELSRSIIQRQFRKKSIDSIKGAVGIVPERQIREAESAYEEAQVTVVSAQQTLVNMGFRLPEGLAAMDSVKLNRALQCLGIPEEMCEQLATDGSMTMNLIPIIAPQAGMIVEMDVVAGEVVQPERTLMTLANLDRMWLTLHVKQEELAYVAVGQKVKFKPDGTKQEIEGTQTFISPSVDEQTRTLRVRAVLDNPGHKLKANSFGTGWIVLREEPKAVTVPVDALQSDGDCQIVFVRDKDFLKDDSPKVFYARQVRVGARSNTHVELLAGVLPGEVIATKGSAAFRAELLKSGFGEGCCGGHAHAPKDDKKKPGGHAGHEH